MSTRRILRAARFPAVPLAAVTSTPALAAAAGVAPSPAPSGPRSAPAGAPLDAELPTRAESWDRASAEGYDAGYRAGIAAARSELDALRVEAERLVEQRRSHAAALAAAVVAVTEQAQAAVARQAAETVEQLGPIACQLAEAVVGHELRHDPHAVLAALQRAVAAAPDGPAVATVHPDDLPIVTVAGGGAAVTFEADPSMERGGCVLRTGAATVDARISTALERTRAALGGARP